MNDEIKEILDRWKCYIGLTKNFTNNDMELLRVEDIEKVLDYITNLQQANKVLEENWEHYMEENERLKNHNRWLEDKIETYFDNVNMQNDLLIEQLDYKSRCEKAIEYIKHCPEYLWANVNTEVLLNILQNGSDEE